MNIAYGIAYDSFRLELPNLPEPMHLQVLLPSFLQIIYSS